MNLRTLMIDDEMGDQINSHPQDERVNQTLDDLARNLQGGATGATESEYNNQKHHMTMIMMESSQNVGMEETGQMHVSLSDQIWTPQLNRQANVSALVHNSALERTQDLIQKKMVSHNRIQVPPVQLQSALKQQSGGSNTQRSGAASARLKFITQGQ